eukprot:TRINITY_DN18200_c0_g1_i2.p1 TRINITY_DN18200_c0_g1~~TRINITY_DN18200_c0_g1_i2.p1  ORF type:complete len:559 (+),score=174.27 TRINITY_DN18200_c0_g1_i2:541-2217(+)
MAYSAIAEAPENVRNSLANATDNLLSNLCQVAKTLDNTAQLPQFIVLLESPLMMDLEHQGTLTQGLMETLHGLNDEMRASLLEILTTCDAGRLERLVDIVQQFITVRLYAEQKIDKFVVYATKFLGVVFEASKLQGKSLKDAMFYNDAINNELDIKHDFVRWRKKQPGDFSFCDCPYILDPCSKSKVLQYDATVQQREAHMSSFMQLDFSPYLVLQVHRDNLVFDTLAQISFDQNLKKSLKVVFIGEEGIDEGGVKKEYFQLLTNELFDAQYGMFSYDDVRHHFWFNRNSFESDSQFKLIGALLGMAIYNSVILDVRFPMVVFKKLKGEPTGLLDLKDYDPDLHAGFNQMLQYDGDVKETFCRKFVFEYEWLGEACEVELKPGGAEIDVDNQNREEYVSLYLEHLFNGSVTQQFEAFSAGFQAVAGGDALKLFNAHELEQLVCGSHELDFDAMQRHSIYDDGYDAEHPVIKHFWEIVHGYSEEEKRALLTFCTGSDRAPIRGLGSMQFVITRGGPDSDRLPVAHTCFNHLLIPDYPTKEKLADKLRFAIKHAHGFGML